MVCRELELADSSEMSVRQTCCVDVADPSRDYKAQGRMGACFYYYGSVSRQLVLRKGKCRCSSGLGVHLGPIVSSFHRLRDM